MLAIANIMQQDALKAEHKFSLLASAIAINCLAFQCLLPLPRLYGQIGWKNLGNYSKACIVRVESKLHGSYCL